MPDPLAAPQLNPKTEPPALQPLAKLAGQVGFSHSRWGLQQYALTRHEHVVDLLRFFVSMDQIRHFQQFWLKNIKYSAYCVTPVGAGFAPAFVNNPDWIGGKKKSEREMRKPNFLGDGAFCVFTQWPHISVQWQ